MIVCCCGWVDGRGTQRDLKYIGSRLCSIVDPAIGARASRPSLPALAWPTTSVTAFSEAEFEFSFRPCLSER